MRRPAFHRLLGTMAILLAAPGLAAPGDRPIATAAGPAARAFELFKGLEGSWEGTNGRGEPIRIEYEVVADGSAVLERFDHPGPGHRTTMLTVYHLDGDRFLLTHYCMAGNQPRMKAVDLSEREVAFDFLDATNLASPADGHMHRAVFRFDEKDRLTTAWTFWRENQPAFTEVVTASRPGRSR